MRLFLNHCGVICPLGTDKASIVRGLDSAAARLSFSGTA